MQSITCASIREYNLPNLPPLSTSQPLKVLLGIITSSKHHNVLRVAAQHRNWLQEVKWPWYPVLATNAGNNTRNFTEMGMPYLVLPRVIHDRFYKLDEGKRSMAYQEAMYRSQLFLEHALLCLPKFDWLMLVDDDVFVQARNVERILEEKDSSKAMVMGCIEKIICDTFCGGAGWIFSRRAVEIIYERRHILAAQYSQIFLDSRDRRFSNFLRDHCSDIELVNLYEFWLDQPPLVATVLPNRMNKTLQPYTATFHYCSGGKCQRALYEDCYSTGVDEKGRSEKCGWRYQNDTLWRETI